jgi:hypothetical protein
MKKKNKIHKKISSLLAIGIIIIFALTVGLFSWFFGKSIKSSTPPIEASEKCKVHAYKGRTTLHVWKVGDGKETSLRVKDEDVDKLPSQNSTTLKLVDPTPEIQNNLSSSSENNPIEIKISGFADKCGKVFLASLEYKDGIFRPYL